MTTTPRVTGLGCYEEAMQEYRRALVLKSEFDVSVIHLANTLYQTGRYREALKQFQHYLEIVPSIVERGRGYSPIARIQLSRGRLDEAERAARRGFASDKTRLGQMLLMALEKSDLAVAAKFNDGLDQIRKIEAQALLSLIFGDERNKGSLCHAPSIIRCLLLRKPFRTSSALLTGVRPSNVPASNKSFEPTARQA